MATKPVAVTKTETRSGMVSEPPEPFAGVVHAPDFRHLFESMPGLYLILAPDLTIVAASDAYLHATRTTRAILGKDAFEIFPDNPDDPTATGQRNVRASFERVLRDRVVDRLAVQRYDLRQPEHEGGGFEERYWSLVTWPLFGKDNRVDYLIHQIEDVSELVLARQRGSVLEERVEKLGNRCQELDREIQQRSRELHELDRRLKDASERLWRSQQEVIEHTRIEQLLREQGEELRVTLESIGDAVIVTEPDGRIRMLNPVAEELTGWPAAEVRGRPLPDVFRIVNQETRQPVENPATRALNEGVIVGLANHTLLIGRDGVARIIDDSAAPIRTAAGDVGAAPCWSSATRLRATPRRKQRARARPAADALRCPAGRPLDERPRRPLRPQQPRPQRTRRPGDRGGSDRSDRIRLPSPRSGAGIPSGRPPGAARR